MHPTWARILVTMPLFVLSALPPTAGAAVVLPTNFINETIVAGLDQPTSFAILPDQRVLVTEQVSGKVRLIVQGHIAGVDPVLVVPSINTTGGERGLQSIAVDPGWPGRPYVYLCYT